MPETDSQRGPVGERLSALASDLKNVVANVEEIKPIVDDTRIAVAGLSIKLDAVIAGQQEARVEALKTLDAHDQQIHSLKERTNALETTIDGRPNHPGLALKVSELVEAHNRRTGALTLLRALGMIGGGVLIGWVMNALHLTQGMHLPPP